MKRLIAFIMILLFCFSCGCSKKYAESVSWEERNFEIVELDNSERYLNELLLDKALLEESMQRACDRWKDNLC